MTTTTVTARTLSALATKATGVKFAGRHVPSSLDTVRLELAGAPLNPLYRVAQAATALRAEGYTVRVIADGWKLAVTV
jgi:hypothetical protein